SARISACLPRRNRSIRASEIRPAEYSINKGASRSSIARLDDVVIILDQPRIESGDQVGHGEEHRVPVEGWTKLGGSRITAAGVDERAYERAVRIERERRNIRVKILQIGRASCRERVKM